MTMRGPGRLVAIALVAAVSIGCGDSEKPGATPTASSSAPVTASQSPSSEPTPSESSSVPTVAPADGPPIRLPSFTGAFPAGWQIVERTKGSNSAGDPDPLTGGFIYISDLENLGARNLDEVAAAVMVQYEDEKHPPKRVENRVVDGIEGWVITGNHKGDLIYEFGTLVGGQDVHFTFDYLHAPKDAMAVIDAVLASVQWR